MFINIMALPLVLVMATSFPTFPTLRPAAPATSGIVADRDGTVYFVDSFRDVVWRVVPGGAPSVFVAGRTGGTLQLDSAGLPYGVHERTDGALVLWRARPDGSISHQPVPTVPAQYGHAFVLGDDGAVVGFSGTRRLPIGAVTRAPAGDLLVASGATVRRIASDGTVSTVAAGERLLEPRHPFLSRLLGDVATHLTGIAAGRWGEIYVANAARGTVLRVTAAGAVEELLRGEGGWTPTGVAAVDGDVYVLEYGPGVRVRRVAADGRVSVLTSLRADRALAGMHVSRFATSPI